MIVIIGHGPSVVRCGLGSWIDQQFVIRLKNGPQPNPEDWGTRTDVLFTSREKCWELNPFGLRYKPSTGLRAILYAHRTYGGKIGLIGFDRLLEPSRITHKWYLEHPEKYWWPHDSEREALAVRSLGIDVVDLRKQCPISSK